MRDRARYRYGVGMVLARCCSPGFHEDAQSQKANVASGVLSETCTIHMGPPLDR